jgi:predicted AlkP superfamily pyrophosphatase or phosphodiesterase
MIRRFGAAALALFAPAAVAQMPPAPAAPPPPPKLLVVVSVDQLSADLFAEYRSIWTGGFKRLSQGVVFPSGYQSQAATETCPGHSTILTGNRPARTGVIANSWIDQSIATREDKGVYCAEDVARGKSSRSRDYVPSPVHLMVPTLGDMMKADIPATRVVAVAGKDRAAIMMGGHKTDEIWFLNPRDYTRFETLYDHTGPVPAAVTRANAAIEAALAKPMPGMKLSSFCATRSRAVMVGPKKVIGDGRFARPARPDKTAERLFRASPESDSATVALAGDLALDMKLGKGAATDVLIVGVSATDVVGHTYGTEGSEMCLQLTALDAQLGTLFARLDKAGIDYAVTLTADHGGHDATERNNETAIPSAQRIAATLSADAVGATIAKELGLPKPALVGAEPSGDIWLDATMAADKKPLALARAKTLFAESPQVAAVYTAAEIGASPAPSGPPETWPLIARIKASYYRGRSGDLYVALKPRVLPIPDSVAQNATYVATHGSPWDYDRRVPILFWRKGLAGFEQPNSVETIDIAPTLAAMIGLKIEPGAMDGRCLDLIAGARDMCPPTRQWFIGTDPGPPLKN